MRTGAILILASAVFFLGKELPHGLLGLFFLTLGCVYLLCGTVLNARDRRKNSSTDKNYVKRNW